MMMMSMKMLFTLYLIVIFVCMVEGNESEKSKYEVKGKCKGIWRPEKLPGRCFGLKLHHKYPELESISVVNDVGTCRAICCNLGDKCVTWQYEKQSKECKLGGPVRLGLENAGVPEWCEPNAPIQWNGYKVTSRDDVNVVWGERVSAQCFGLGDERKDPQGNRYNIAQCQQACIDFKGCMIWQEYPGRGCYLSKEKGVGCDDKANAVYEGGRKCIPKFCGNMEEAILGFNATYPAPDTFIIV